MVQYFHHLTISSSTRNIDNTFRMDGSTRPQNTYYHPSSACIRAKHPQFTPEQFGFNKVQGMLCKCEISPETLRFKLLMPVLLHLLLSLPIIF